MTDLPTNKIPSSRKRKKIISICVLFLSGCSFNNLPLQEPYEINYFKYDSDSAEFNMNCKHLIEICDMWQGNKVSALCTSYAGGESIYPIRAYSPYYKVALSEDRSHVFLKKEKGDFSAFRLPVKNNCTITQQKYKLEKEKEKKARIQAAEAAKKKALQEEQRQKAEEKAREALRKKQIEAAKKQLPASCRDIIHLKKKGTGGWFGSQDTTIGDFLAEKVVDIENVSIQCTQVQNQLDGKTYNAIGYAREGEDYRGIFFSQRNGWVLCRGIYSGNDIEENKTKCEASFTAFGSLIKTTQEELEAF